MPKIWKKFWAGAVGEVDKFSSIKIIPRGARERERDRVKNRWIKNLSIYIYGDRWLADTSHESPLVLSYIDSMYRYGTKGTDWIAMDEEYGFLRTALDLAIAGPGSACPARRGCITRHPCFSDLSDFVLFFQKKNRTHFFSPNLTFFDSTTFGNMIAGWLDYHLTECVSWRKI